MPKKWDYTNKTKMKIDTEIQNDIIRKTPLLRLLTEEECALLKQTLLQSIMILPHCDK